jgi:glycosyl transferase family 1
LIAISKPGFDPKGGLCSCPATKTLTELRIFADLYKKWRSAQCHLHDASSRFYRDFPLFIPAIFQSRREDDAARCLGAKGDRPPNRSRPFRIGVWCYYGATLKPTSGIGVFVYNLIAGLFQLEEDVEVVVLAAPDSEEAASWLKPWARGRLRVLAEHVTWWEQGGLWLKVLLKWLWWNLRLFTNWLLLLSWRSRNGPRYFRGPVMVTTAARRFTRYFLGMVRQLRHRRNRRLPNRNKSLALARKARCDVWVIPYVGFEYPLPQPSILFIHDLVTSHFPRMFDTDFVRHINRLAPIKAAEATLCACMSEFIRDTDLLGILDLPSAKVRMIPFAPPADFPLISDDQSLALKPDFLKRPYLFLPAAFHGHKNHRTLVLALRHLRDAHGEADLDLVLTGNVADSLPIDLDWLIRDCGLSQRVHVLGSVCREVLAALYQGAFATIVPTLYEQGSFPIYEAIHWHCPVACSDIKPLRDQCATMGDAMLYFDPLDPQDIARVILLIRADREAVSSRQQQASAVLWNRTWTDVGRECLEVFKEAAGIAHCGLQSNLCKAVSNHLKQCA